MAFLIRTSKARGGPLCKVDLEDRVSLGIAVGYAKWQSGTRMRDDPE
jgi:hypothetical protein